MAIQDINEPVNILASFRQTAHGAWVAKPEFMTWHDRRYRVQELGLRYPTSKGNRLRHRFTFSVDDTAFEVEFDAELLAWHLVRISDGNPT